MAPGPATSRAPERLAVELSIAASPAAGSSPPRREWSMIANTGQPMPRSWGWLVLDLAGAQFKQKLALLLDHSTNQRVGFSTRVERTGRGLEASGRLLRNRLAEQIAADSAGGFPFQASLMAIPQAVEQLDEGQSAEVNGRTVQGPLVIFREWTVRELTVTTIGADPDTQTHAFSQAQTGRQTMTKTRARAASSGASVPSPSHRQTGDVADERLEFTRTNFRASPGLQAEFFGSEETYLAFVENAHRCRDFGMTAEMLTAGLSGFSFRNVKGSFFWGMEERERALWTKLVATDVTSDQPYETHKGLGSVPAPQKWAGERRRQSLRDFGLVVVSEKWEQTITVDIDDLRRDKTGAIGKRVAELGAKGATLPQRIFTTLLEANPVGYDGANFFADSHNHGGTVDNSLAASASSAAAPTSAEMSVAILAAIQAQLGFTDDRGEPCNEDAQAFAVVVPPKYFAAAIAAKNNDFTSAGTSNTVKTSGMNIEVLVNARLTAANNVFFTFRTDAPLGALLWQEEELEDAFKTLGPNSSEAFWKEQVAFGGKRVGNGALARFELATRTTFS